MVYLSVDLDLRVAHRLDHGAGILVTGEDDRAIGPLQDTVQRRDVISG
jgi:hypothetical protein